jgi:hypothetical protein
MGRDRQSRWNGSSRRGAAGSRHHCRMTPDCHQTKGCTESPPTDRMRHHHLNRRRALESLRTGARRSSNPMRLSVHSKSKQWRNQ